MDSFYSDKYNLDSYSSDLSKSKSSKRKKRSANQKPSRKRKAPNNVYRAQRKNPKPRRGVRVLVTVLIVLVVLGGAIFAGYHIYWNYKKSQPFKYSEGVKVSGINISGLSVGEAKVKLKRNSLKAVDDFELRIVANKTEKTYDKNDFTYSFDYNTPLEEARIYSLKEQGIYEPPKDASESEDSGELTMPKLKLEYTFDTAKADEIAQKTAKKVNREPTNAEVKAFHPFSQNRFEYSEGAYGYELDEEDLSSQIKEFMLSGEKNKTIKADVEKLIPDITVDDLEDKIVGLSTATSTSYNNENGNTNMAIAMKACNGSVIEPGETWSFNECTGDSNDPANGYKKATVITDRKLEEGVGGGICQASTTIFQAGMFANMGVVERHNHYWASGYAYSGEDATIDYPNLDLKLTNNTSYQMFMECKMEGTVLQCNIYGVQEDYYDNIKVYTKNYDIVKKKSYSTDTYRVLYLKGEIVSEDIVCQSGYSLTDKHVVQDADKGTFRTMVDGTSHAETDPPKTKPTTEPAEESNAENDEDETVTESQA